MPRLKFGALDVCSEIDGNFRKRVTVPVFDSHRSSFREGRETAAVNFKKFVLLPEQIPDSDPYRISGGSFAYPRSPREAHALHTVPKIVGLPVGLHDREFLTGKQRRSAFSCGRCIRCIGRRSPLMASPGIPKESSSISADRPVRWTDFPDPLFHLWPRRNFLSKKTSVLRFSRRRQSRSQV